MNKKQFKRLYRAARCGDLNFVACSLKYESYQWFLREVYDLRFPAIGDQRGLRGNSRFVVYHTFDSLAGHFSWGMSKFYHRIYKII